MGRFVYGWRRDIEDHKWLAAKAMKTYRGPPKGFKAPAKMDCRGILTVENQGQLGSCTGQAVTNGGELLQFTKNGGKKQLSRMFAYIMGQKASGIRGDNGATIAGSIQAATSTGYCLESECPYPSRYTTAGIGTKAQIESAAKRRLLAHVPLTTPQACFDFVSQARGPIMIGFSVTPAYEDLQGKNSIVTPKVLSGRDVGGHAVLLAGYQQTDQLDQIGSWDKTWGDQGWAPWTMEAIEFLCRTEQGQQSIFGMTDIDGFDQERVDRICDFGENV